MGCLLLFIIIIGFPAAEFMVMGKVAAWIGLGDMLVLLILSALFGSYLAKHQGNLVFSRVQQCMMQGRTPTLEMVDGLLVFLGGLLFVFPGFISDVFGLVFVFPLTRWLVRGIVLAGFKARDHAFTQERRTGVPKPPQSKGIDKAGAVDAEVV